MASTLNPIAMATTRTHQLPRGAISPHRNPLFDKLPDQYYGYALQWCAYPRWTIEEAANLLTGCVPHRQMFLRGENHKILDAEVLATENKIRVALGRDLTVVESKKYFDKTYIDASNVIDWAVSTAITVPEALLKAQRESRSHRQQHGYLTPCMAAANWVVDTFWKPADLREPPTEGEIINALLQQFPNLAPDECQMVEYITRHPAARPDSITDP